MHVTTTPLKSLLLVGTFGPFAAATWVRFKEGGPQRLTSLLKQALIWSFGWRIAATVLLLPFTVAGLSYKLAGGGAIADRPILLLGTYILYFFLGGSFAEEFGWRGLAWPDLRNRFGPLMAAITLGLLWACFLMRLL